MKRFLSSCARLPRVGFAVALDALPSLPTSKKQTLAILLLAVAGATGVMGRNASAGSLLLELRPLGRLSLPSVEQRRTWSPTTCRCHLSERLLLLELPHWLSLWLEL